MSFLHGCTQVFCFSPEVFDSEPVSPRRASATSVSPVMVLGCVHAPVTSFTDAHRSSVSPEVCVCSKCNCNVCFSCYVSRLQSGFSVLLTDVHRQGLCLLDVPFHGLLFSFWHFFGVEAFSVPGLRDFFLPMRILVQGLLCRTFTFLGCYACCEERGGLFIASFFFFPISGETL